VEGGRKCSTGGWCGGVCSRDQSMERAWRLSTMLGRGGPGCWHRGSGVVMGKRTSLRGRVGAGATSAWGWRQAEPVRARARAPSNGGPCGPRVKGHGVLASA